MAAQDSRFVRNGGLRFDPSVIGDIPSDWQTKSYLLGVIPDPDDPTQPIAAWVEATGDVLIGWGFNFGGNFGGGS